VPLTGVINIEDLRRAARQRLPRVAFDYIDGGAEREFTLRENCRAFEMVTFRPRSAVATQECRLQTTVLGTPLALPLLLAPVGSSRLFYPRGEAVAAEGAGNAGTAYILSTLSGCRLEEVKTASKGPVWYQLYLVGGRDVAKGAIERARAAGFSALVITIDTPVAGLRERDLRNGMTRLVSRRFWSMLPVVSQFLARPRWLAGFLSDGGLMAFPNVVLPGVGPMSYADVGAALEQSMVAWDDLRWIRETWKGPIVVKGVLTGEDARRAVAEGADAVVVSPAGGVIKMVSGLVVVLAVMALVAWLAKRMLPSMGGSKQSVARVVGSVSVGSRERVVVVQVADRWLVVGVAPGQVNSIANLEAGALQLAEHLPEAIKNNTISSDFTQAFAPSFADWLQKSTAKFKEKLDAKK